MSTIKITKSQEDFLLWILTYKIEVLHPVRYTRIYDVLFKDKGTYNKKSWDRNVLNATWTQYIDEYIKRS